MKTISICKDDFRSPFLWNDILNMLGVPLDIPTDADEGLTLILDITSLEYTDVDGAAVVRKV